MSKITKPVSKPTSSKGDIATDLQLGRVSSARQDFMIAAANMSWQLAIVVLVPLLGGFELDRHLNSVPLWTIVGFIIATLGMGLVVWRQLQAFNPTVTAADIANAKKLRDAEDDEG